MKLNACGFLAALLSGPTLLAQTQLGVSTPTQHGVSIGVIDSTAIAASLAHTLSELLAARVPGVSVLRSSGAIGTGSRVRLRGASSFFAPREPIVILDGVRADALQDAPGLAIGGQQPSRLDDLDLEQIARIEILRGPAASALYGTNGAGGVILITTKAAARGKPSWAAYAEGGASADVTDYPANYSTGSGVTGEPTCMRSESAAGMCTPGPLLSWSPLEGASPFRTAGYARLVASVSGGSTRFGYLASTTVHQEAGVLTPNDASRYAARVNLDGDVTRSLRLAVRTSYVGANTTLPLGDMLFGSTLGDGLTGNAIDDPVKHGYRTDVPGFRDTPTEHGIDRGIGSLAATWTPTRWLTARASAGGEQLHRDDARTTSLEPNPFPSNTLIRVQQSRQRDTRTTLSTSATASVRLARTLATETTLGVERSSVSTHLADSSAVVQNDFLVAYEASSQRTRSHFTGLIASERIAWQDRRFLGVGVRRDKPNFAGFEPATFVSADAAWEIGEEPFFSQNTVVSQLRFRAAYGRSTDMRTYAFVPASILPPTTGQPRPNRLPGESVSETELGLDARLFGRVGLGATWYRQQSTDALALGCCATSFAPARGAWHTTGLDAAISAAIVNSVDVDWSASLTVALFSNRVDDLGEGRRQQPVPPVLLSRVRVRNVVGHPIAGIWGNATHVRDDNGDGVIVPGEVDIATDTTFLGSSIPTREIALSTTVALRRATFNLQLDYRGGFRQINLTEDLRCEFQICRAQYDPGASVDDQGRAVVVYEAGAGFVEDGSFVRLREIGVTWKLLPGWAHRHGFARLNLTVGARNLVTYTRYSGLDPEVNYLGQSNLSTAEFFTLPVPRTFLVRVDVQH